MVETEEKIGSAHMKNLRKVGIEMDFKETIQHRRSHYALSKSSPITDDAIVALIEHAVAYTPSAFNSQSPKVTVLLGAKSDQLWDIVMETLRGVVPAAAFAATEEKINSFKAGHGTVLYFNDDAITKGLQDSFPLYADNFPIWAEQANGMLQFSIWNLLEQAGLGASLQHYNPIIDEKVHAAFGIPAGDRLIAQMPFGAPVAQPGAKEFADIHTRVTIIQ